MSKINQMIIGLTGGIATGKSNVSKFLSNHGFYVVDADKITHLVQAKGQPGLKAIIKYFGIQYLNSDHELNRRKLGQWVFTHHQDLRKLVRIIDPFIRQATIKSLKHGCKVSNHVLLDAPTLFESGYQYLVDKIMVVACDPVIQLNRLSKRDHLSITAAESRINSQWPLNIKEVLANWVINSDGSRAQTLSQVEELVKQRQI